jgi:hypothetical protein
VQLAAGRKAYVNLVTAKDVIGCATEKPLHSDGRTRAIGLRGVDPLDKFGSGKFADTDNSVGENTQGWFPTSEGGSVAKTLPRRSSSRPALPSAPASLGDFRCAGSGIARTLDHPKMALASRSRAFAGVGAP